jgi:hypothetical protein
MMIASKRDSVSVFIGTPNSKINDFIKMTGASER